MTDSNPLGVDVESVDAVEMLAVEQQLLGVHRRDQDRMEDLERADRTRAYGWTLAWSGRCVYRGQLIVGRGEQGNRVVRRGCVGRSRGRRWWPFPGLGGAQLAGVVVDDEQIEDFDIALRAIGHAQTYPVDIGWNEAPGWKTCPAQVE